MNTAIPLLRNRIGRTMDLFLKHCLDCGIAITIYRFRNNESSYFSDFVTVAGRRGSSVSYAKPGLAAVKSSWNKDWEGKRNMMMRIEFQNIFQAWDDRGSLWKQAVRWDWKLTLNHVLARPRHTRLNVKVLDLKTHSLGPSHGLTQRFNRYG